MNTEHHTCKTCHHVHKNSNGSCQCGCEVSSPQQEHANVDEKEKAEDKSEDDDEVIDEDQEVGEVHEEPEEEKI